jgi:hypothetical protein
MQTSSSTGSADGSEENLDQLAPSGMSLTGRSSLRRPAVLSAVLAGLSAVCLIGACGGPDSGPRSAPTALNADDAARAHENASFVAEYTFTLDVDPVVTGELRWARAGSNRMLVEVDFFRGSYMATVGAYLDEDGGRVCIQANEGSRCHDLGDAIQAFFPSEILYAQSIEDSSPASNASFADQDAFCVSTAGAIRDCLTADGIPVYSTGYARSVLVNFSVGFALRDGSEPAPDIGSAHGEVVANNVSRDLSKIDFRAPALPVVPIE